MTDMRMMAEAKIAELGADKAFVEKIAKIQDPEELSKAFSEKGEAMSVEEARQVLEYVKNAQNEELDAEALENVAGGIHPILALGAIVFVGGSLILGYVDGVKSGWGTCTTNKKNKKKNK